MCSHGHLESPHVYKIGGYYYLMAAEGGTEYGHMITCARSKDIWGVFENCPQNPILTNRNKATFTVYMCESEHYDIAIRKTDKGLEAVLKLNIGGIKHTQTVFQLKSGSEKLKIIGDNLFYNFYIGDTHLGCGQAKYLSSEVSGGFTGVVIGLYAIGNNSAEFEDFRIEYKYTTE